MLTKLKSRNKTMDLTEGPLLSKMIRFVLPLMATNFLQTFYNAADMMVVSLSSETNAVGAIGATGSLTTLIVNLFMGFAVGTNILVARYLGAKDHERVKKTVHTSILMSLIFGGVAVIIGLLASRLILRMMGADGKILDLATLYTKIYFCGAPFLAATNYLSAIFRAKGDTETPLMVLSVSGIINVLLNLLFVLGLGMSVEGVAIATAIANLLSSLTLFFILSKDDGLCKVSFDKLKIDGGAFAGIVREGLPAGIQGSLFSFSNIIMQSSVFRVNNALVGAASEYAPVVNGAAATANLESFINTAINSIYQSTITFTSQNFGAKKYKRIKKIMVTSALFSMGIGVAISGLMIIFRAPMLSLYGVKDGIEGSMDQLAFRAALTRMVCVTAPYFLLGFMNVTTGVMRGLGKTMTSTVISLIGACLLRIFWIYSVFEFFPPLDPFPTLAMVYLSFPITWIITGVTQLLFSVFTLRSHLKKA